MIRANRVLFLLLFSVSALGFSGARADSSEIEELTKKNVINFIERTTVITSGEDDEMSLEDISAYLSKHIHKKARFVSTMRFTMPGMPPQDTKISLKKKDYIESIEKGDQALDDYESEVEIKSVKISRDKKQATVQTVARETGEIPTKLDTGETQYVPVEGSSECTQILSLKKGDIQMYSANCLTTIDFLPL